MFKISNLCLNVQEKNILNDFNLTIKDSEVHTIMGKNGVGKSSICRAIMNDKNYIINSGNIYYNDEDITNLSTYEIVRKGIMYISQNPISIEGISNAEMLRTTLRDIKNENINIFEFNKEMETICKKLDLDISFIHKDVNVGASGGERKKVELLHMGVLKPKFIILDEIDSGLDVDSLKVVANFINDYHKETNCSILLITHHTNILKYIKTDYVHILSDGKITKTGNHLLAEKLENEGFTRANVMSDSAYEE